LRRLRWRGTSAGEEVMEYTAHMHAQTKNAPSITSRWRSYGAALKLLDSGGVIAYAPTMNSTPLSAPDGTVYAYACGECKRVPWGSYDRTGKVTVADDAARSKLVADKCCLCSDCKVVQIKGHGPCPACFEQIAKEEAAAQLKRVEKSSNPEAALELLEEMSVYFRNHYDCNWLENGEFAIHDDLEAMLSSESGREYDTPRLLSDLRDGCGGWWTREDGDEPRFVTTAEWLDLVAARRK